MKSAKSKLIERYVRHSSSDNVHYKTVARDLDLSLMDVLKLAQHSDVLRLHNNHISVA